MNKILEKKQELRRCLFSIILLKKKKTTAYSYNGESKLITKKKKNYAYTRDAQFRDIICQNHVIVFKEGRIFFAKELKVDCK